MQQSSEISLGQRVDQIPTTALTARDRLAAIVERGVSHAAPIVARILDSTPTDRIVRGAGLDFATSGAAPMVLYSRDEVSEPMHAHAWAQVLSRAGIPKPYGDTLVAGDEWQRSLMAYILRAHYGNDPARYLARSRNGQLRGFLSDHYRRLDSRPLLDAFIGACNGVGAVPYEGVANEVRSSVRAIIPTVHEPVPGEALALGLSWSNSDYGSGTYSISAFVLRLQCLNGMIGESPMRQVHLGGKLPDDLAFSERTYASDTRTMVLATGDVVRGLLGPRAIETRFNAIREAHATETDFAKAWQRAKVSLTKGEAERAKEAFEGRDVVMLPPGRTLWRASNALSWLANNTEDPERKLELQAAAGALVRAA